MFQNDARIGYSAHPIGQTSVASTVAINLIFSRDKTLIGDEPLEIRSNRTTFVLSKGGIVEAVAARGHTLAGTVRMTAILMQAFLRNEDVFRESTPPDFLAAWERAASPYEDTYLNPNWVSAHINGVPYFDTIGQNSHQRTPLEAEQDLAMGEMIDAIEKVARGGDLSDAIIRDAVDRITPGRSTRHETQTAVVLTESRDNTKCAILERSAGSKRSVSLTVMTDKTPILLMTLLFAAADVIELTNLTGLITRANRPTGAKSAPSSDIPPAQLLTATNRRRNLLDVMRGFEKAYMARYRPDRPKCFEIIPPPPSR